MQAKITNEGDDYVFVYLCVTVARDYTEAENTVNLTKLEFMTRAKRLSNTDIPISAPWVRNVFICAS